MQGLAGENPHYEEIVALITLNPTANKLTELLDKTEDDDLLADIKELFEKGEEIKTAHLTSIKDALDMQEGTTLH